MSLPADIEEAIAILAKRDAMPEATKALHLITIALELEEDDLWNAIAEKRDIKSATFIDHDSVWT